MTSNLWYNSGLILRDILIVLQNRKIILSSETNFDLFFVVQTL